MLGAMRTLALLLLLLLVGGPAVANAAIPPEAVAILFNSRVPESRHLAEVYQAARNIPTDNLIGLDMPQGADITRVEYENAIQNPLRREFDKRGWWKRQSENSGITLPIANRIRVLVTIRGVPLRILPKGKDAPIAVNQANPLAGHDEASVDSELAMFGVEGLPADGVLQNKFYRSDVSITQANMPFLVLTARIDAASVATCERMIRDAVEAEATGLWGMAYVDIANKFPQGDQWLEGVVKSNVGVGIPTVVDRFDETFPTNYPMTDAALYYGWYDWNVSGPFLNSRFRFRKGAVAMHLHSFSAEQINNPSKNWSAPLLERGAAVTIGNVFEPYLHLTHDFTIIQQKLLADYTWGEACWMAMPVASWQAVVLGDPLYRPFMHLDGGGTKQAGDIEYRALRAAAIEWKDKPSERRMQLEKAAERMQSGILAEALGLESIERADPIEASRWFNNARLHYVKAEDKMRQDFSLIAIERNAKRKDAAIQKLRDARMRYGALPEADAFKVWLDLLLPPPAPSKP